MSLAVQLSHIHRELAAIDARLARAQRKLAGRDVASCVGAARGDIAGACFHIVHALRYGVDPVIEASAASEARA